MNRFIFFRPSKLISRMGSEPLSRREYLIYLLYLASQMLIIRALPGLISSQQFDLVSSPSPVTNILRILIYLGAFLLIIKIQWGNEILNILGKYAALYATQFVLFSLMKMSLILGILYVFVAHGSVTHPDFINSDFPNLISEILCLCIPELVIQGVMLYWFKKLTDLEKI